MKLIAHRGIHQKKIEENTLKSFIDVINNVNYKGFECDVRETKDKKYIINHNASINNLLIKKNNSKKFNKCNLSNILNLDTDKIMLIEIKDIDIDVIRINKILNEYNNKKIYVMSFHNTVIEKLYNLKHSYKLGILNYILNNEIDYKYDFICLLDTFATEKNINKYNKKEVFIYGIMNNKYNHGNKCYYITDEYIK